MEAEGAIIAALNDVRAEFPAMRVRTEHVVLDGPLTVFRATIALPTGAEASGYGSVVGTGVDAIALAEGRAIARAMALLGVDQDAYDAQSHVDDVDLGREGPGGDEPYARGGLTRAVADEAPADPFNLGPSPSAAAVASATGLRLGARSNPPGPGDGDSPPGEAPSASRPSTGTAPVPVVPPATAPAEATQDATGDGTTGQPAAGQPDGETGTSDDDAAVSHQAFWRWAGERGLTNRSAVEDLLGQSIGGMRPAAVRDLIMAAQESGGDGG